MLNRLVAGVVGSSIRVVELDTGAACRRDGGVEAEKVVETPHHDPLAGTRIPR